MTPRQEELYWRYYRLLGEPIDQDLDVLARVCDFEQLSPRDPIITLLIYLVAARRTLGHEQQKTSSEIIGGLRSINGELQGLAAAVRANGERLRYINRLMGAILLIITPLLLLAVGLLVARFV